jgi:hypothetical protein
MSEPDAVPLPREGEVFFDVRGEARTLRLSWYADSAVAVFSIWHQNRCMGTFRLPFVDLVRMVETLQSGPPSRTADAISRQSADPSFTSAGHDRGYGHGEPTGYLPAATYGHQAGYESGRGYESGLSYESERGYESGRSYESERGYGYETGPHYGSEPIYGAEQAYRSGPGYGAGLDYHDPPGYRDTQRQPPGGPDSQQVSGPHQGYADQAGYPDPAGYPRTGEYAEPAGYPDYPAGHPGQSAIRPAHRLAPGAVAHEGRLPVASGRHPEWSAAPSHRADSSMPDFPSAPASDDLESSDWDAATASYRAP